MLVAAARFRPAQPAAAARRPVPAGLPLDAVRAGQVRHPAAAPAAGGTGRRQCAGRGRHLRRHPDRHPCRRPAGRQRRHGTPGSRGGCSASPSLGYLASRAIPPPPPPTPICASTGIRSPRPGATSTSPARNRTVFLSILGISWFWLYGALFLAQFPAYAKDVLGGGEAVVTLLLATFTIGIGVGSLLCERLSGAQGRNRPGAVRLDRPDAVRARSRLRRPRRRAARPRRWASAASVAQAACLARAVRPAADRPLRRLLHRAALRAGAAALRARAPRAHHRRQQHPQRPVHGGRRRWPPSRCCGPG